MNNYKIPLFERIVSSVSYLTMGWGGMIYLIYTALRHKNLSHFTRFNIFQSIFLAFLYFVLAMTIGFILTILSYIPLINILAAKLTHLLHKNFLFDYSLIQILVFGFILYMSIYSLFGKYPRLYGLSNIIDKQAK